MSRVDSLERQLGFDIDIEIGRPCLYFDSFIETWSGLVILKTCIFSKGTIGGVNQADSIGPEIIISIKLCLISQL